MWHVDDGQLHAYLDGQLEAVTGDAATRIAEHIASCAACQARLEEEERVRAEAAVLLDATGPGGSDAAAPAFEALKAGTLVHGGIGSATATRPDAPSRSGFRRSLPWAAALFMAVAGGWYARTLFDTAASDQVAMRELPAAERVETPEGSETDQGSAAPAMPPAQVAVAPTEAAAEAGEPRRAGEVAERIQQPDTRDAPEPPAPRVALAEPDVQAGRRTPVPGLSPGAEDRAPAVPETARTEDRAAARTAGEGAAVRTGERVGDVTPPVDAPPPVALQEVVVTGGARPAGAVVSAGGVAVLMAADWEVADPAAAERMLGGTLARIEGLTPDSVWTADVSGRAAVRMLLRLEDGSALELYQQARPVSGAQRAERFDRAAEDAAVERRRESGPRLLSARVTESGSWITAEWGAYLLHLKAPVPLEALREALDGVR